MDSLLFALDPGAADCARCSRTGDGGLGRVVVRAGEFDRMVLAGGCLTGDGDRLDEGTVGDVLMALGSRPVEAGEYPDTFLALARPGLAGTASADTADLAAAGNSCRLAGLTGRSVTGELYGPGWTTARGVLLDEVEYASEGESGSVDCARVRFKLDPEADALFGPSMRAKGLCWLRGLTELGVLESTSAETSTRALSSTMGEDLAEALPGLAFAAGPAAGGVRSSRRANTRRLVLAVG